VCLCVCVWLIPKLSFFQKLEVPLDNNFEFRSPDQPDQLFENCEEGALLSVCSLCSAGAGICGCCLLPAACCLLPPAHAPCLLDNASFRTAARERARHCAWRGKWSALPYPALPPDCGRGGMAVRCVEQTGPGRWGRRLPQTPI
jgi:hypothetical protein